MAAPDYLALAEPGPFAIRVVAVDARSKRLIVEGELDLLTAPQLQQALDGELEVTDEVVLDLSRVCFIDSAGLKAIVLALQDDSPNAGKIKISESLPAQARRLFELVGVFGQLPLVAS